MLNANLSFHHVSSNVSHGLDSSPVVDPVEHLTEAPGHHIEPGAVGLGPDEPFGALRRRARVQQPLQPILARRVLYIPSEKKMDHIYIYIYRPQDLADSVIEGAGQKEICCPHAVLVCTYTQPDALRVPRPLQPVLP